MQWTVGILLNKMRRCHTCPPYDFSYHRLSIVYLILLSLTCFSFCCQMVKSCDQIGIFLWLDMIFDRNSSVDMFLYNYLDLYIVCYFQLVMIFLVQGRLYSAITNIFKYMFLFDLDLDIVSYLNSTWFLGSKTSYTVQYNLPVCVPIISC